MGKWKILSSSILKNKKDLPIDISEEIEWKEVDLIEYHADIVKRVDNLIDETEQKILSEEELIEQKSCINCEQENIIRNI